jgi:hypothetical protein
VTAAVAQPTERLDRRRTTTASGKGFTDWGCHFSVRASAHVAVGPAGVWNRHPASQCQMSPLHVRKRVRTRQSLSPPRKDLYARDQVTFDLT